MIKKLKSINYSQLVVFLFLLVAIPLTVQAFITFTEPVGKAKGPKKQVELLTSDTGFKKGNAVYLDFSQVDCCRILGSEYSATHGVTFENDIVKGWATYQANGFANHLSGAPAEPGAPTGTTGTRLTLSKGTKKVGMYIQAGSPFNYDFSAPSKSITIRAYDEVGGKIFEQTANTCLNGGSCPPKFIGVESYTANIKALEIVINEAYNWSIDDLKWEKTGK